MKSVMQSHKVYPNEVGVKGLGFYIPNHRISADEIAEISGIPVHVLREKIGFDSLPIAGKDEHPTQMGLEAAKRAMQSAGIQADEVDILIYVGIFYRDYGCWFPSSYLQHELGLKNAFAFEMLNGCNGVNLAIHTAKCMLKEQKHKKNALIITSDKLSVMMDYKNPRLLSIFHASDGAGAMVLSKGISDNVVLAYDAITDGKASMQILNPNLGTVAYAKDDSVEPREMYKIDVKDPKVLSEILSDVYIQNYKRVITGALEKSSASTEDISFLLTNQVKRSTIEAILNVFTLKMDSTVLSIKHYGHMGANDSILGLSHLIQGNKIKSGDVVVLASSAMGFSWASTVIKFLESPSIAIQSALEV